MVPGFFIEASVGLGLCRITRMRSLRFISVLTTALCAVVGQSSLAQTAPVAVSGTGTYTAACAVVLDPVTSQPMSCGPDSSFARATGGGSLALGRSSASGAYTVAIGDGASVGAAANAVGIGARSIVTNDATNSVALGADSVANEANTVSVGSSFSSQRRLVNVGAGLVTSDAATIGQLDQLAAGQGAWLGGGANVTKSGGGVYIFHAPSYALSSPGALGTYNDVGGALSALDRGLSSLYNTVNSLPASGTGPSGPEGPAGPQGPTGDTGPQGPAVGGSDDAAVRYDDSALSNVTLQGKGGTQIHNLAAGAASTDAANVAQLDAATANAIATAKTYTDVSASRTLQSANDYTDWRVSQLDDRFRKQEASINRAGAVASAMGLMAGSAASIQNADVLSMAVAGYRGAGAVSVGINHHFSERVALTVGAAFGASNEGSVGAGLAIGLH